MGIIEEDIIIIGGGLGGLTAACLLAKNGRSVILVEKKTYPFHRVCGEYISNEVKAFLQKEKLFPTELQPAEVTDFTLTSAKGKRIDMPLDLGGFGISRYAFDEYLYHKAISHGVTVRLGEQVEQVKFFQKKNTFEIELNSGERMTADHVLGAFGKRSKIDKALSRSFIEKRTPHIGVKYHVKGNFNPHTVAIHHFPGGYCGISPIENNTFNLCYLGNKEQLRASGTIPKMEEKFLYQNASLRRIFEEASFVHDKPEVINEINFEPKPRIENHLLMAGDSAGMIAPLCGNGMAIAIHSGKLAAEAILMNSDRDAIENHYLKAWNRQFRYRLTLGRWVQRLFDYPMLANSAIAMLQYSPSLAKQIMKQTHGKTF